jgi:hypothetical protein
MNNGKVDCRINRATNQVLPTVPRKDVIIIRVVRTKHKTCLISICFSCIVSHLIAAATAKKVVMTTKSFVAQRERVCIHRGSLNNCYGWAIRGSFASSGAPFASPLDGLYKLTINLLLLMDLLVVLVVTRINRCYVSKRFVRDERSGSSMYFSLRLVVVAVLGLPYTVRLTAGLPNPSGIPAVQ